MATTIRYFTPMLHVHWRHWVFLTFAMDQGIISSNIVGLVASHLSWSIVWPQNMKLDVADWQCWQSMLMALLHLGHQQTLDRQLGAWVSAPAKSGCFLEHITSAVWYKGNKGWTRHTQIPGRTRAIFFHWQGTREDGPSYPVEVAKQTTCDQCMYHWQGH